MNRGWKRGIDQVSSPRAAENLNSPMSSFNLRRLPLTFTDFKTTLNSWDWLINTSAVGQTQTVYLPPNPAIGDMVAITRYRTTGAITVTGPTNSIMGSSTFAFTSAITTGAAQYQTVVFAYIGNQSALGSPQWVIWSITGADGAQGFYSAGVIQAVTGTNTASSAAVTTPTLGAAAQLAQTAADAMLYIVIGTAGTAFTIAIGPTSGVANTIVNSVVATSGAMYTVRLPAGWYIAVSGTTATWTTTAVVC